MRQLIIASVLMGLLLTVGCKPKEDNPTPPLTVDSTAVYLKLNLKKELGASYRLDNGWIKLNATDSVTVRAFAMFISNIKLTNTTTGATWTEPDSYHLGLFVSDSAHVLLKLKNLPGNGTSWDRLDFGIGVDSAANTNISYVGKGDLLFGKGMEWSWAQGWKFVLLEGQYGSTRASRGNLVYHIGFDTNYRTRQLTFASPLTIQRGQQVINFNVNLPAAFSATTNIDVTTVNDEMGNSANARALANNFGSPSFLEFINLQPLQ